MDETQGKGNRVLRFVFRAFEGVFIAYAAVLLDRWTRSDAVPVATSPAAVPKSSSPSPGLLTMAQSALTWAWELVSHWGPPIAVALGLYLVGRWFGRRSVTALAKSESAKTAPITGDERIRKYRDKIEALLGYGIHARAALVHAQRAYDRMSLDPTLAARVMADARQEQDDIEQEVNPAICRMLGSSRLVESCPHPMTEFPTGVDEWRTRISRLDELVRFLEIAKAEPSPSIRDDANFVHNLKPRLHGSSIEKLDALGRPPTVSVVMLPPPLQQQPEERNHNDVDSDLWQPAVDATRRYRDEWNDRMNGLQPQMTDEQMRDLLKVAVWFNTRRRLRRLVGLFDVCRRESDEPRLARTVAHASDFVGAAFGERARLNFEAAPEDDRQSRAGIDGKCSIYEEAVKKLLADKRRSDLANWFMPSAVPEIQLGPPDTSRKRSA